MELPETIKLDQKTLLGEKGAVRVRDPLYGRVRVRVRVRDPRVREDQVRDR